MNTPLPHSAPTAPSPDAAPSPPGGHTGEADRRALLAGAAGLAAGALLIGARSAHAGPLNPPPGPITPTGKTTQEVFDAVAGAQTALSADARRGWVPLSAATTPGIPGLVVFRITQPGAYYLTQPLDAGTSGAAIAIEIDDVTLDLNGFTISADGTARSAINAANFGDRARIIRNGTIRVSNGAVGITVGSDNMLIEAVRLIALSGANGVRINGAYGVTIRRCDFWAAGDSTTPAGTAVASGTGPRSVTLDHLTVGGEGAWAAGLIAAGVSSAARRCVVSGVNGTAISLGDSSSVEGCTAVGGSIIVGNSSTVIDSSVDRGTGFGIDAGTQSLIERCRAVGNTGGGIRISENSVVRGCVVDFHQATGLSGIRSSGNNTQVLDNAINRCNIGINFQAVSGCVAFRNTCRLCPTGVAVSFGGNWYPFVDFSNVNTATNPFANLFTNG
jgi:hypothetical protein